MTKRNVLYTGIFLVCIFLFLKYVMPYVAPFVIGAFLAFLLDPVVDFFENRLRLGRGWAAIISMVIFALVVGTILTWCVASLVAEISDLYRQLPEYYGQFGEILDDILANADKLWQDLPEPLARAVQNVWNSLYDLLSGFALGAGELVKLAPGFSISVIFTVISTYLFIKDKNAIYESVGKILPEETFGTFKSTESTILSGAARVIRVEILLIILTMIVNTLGLRIINVRYAVALGVILAILDIVPIIGPALIYIPWIIYHLIWGQLSVAIYLAVLYGGVSFARQVARTNLIGKEMGLHPLVTLISLYLGFRLFGAVGIIYGPLVAVLLTGFWASLITPVKGGNEG